MVQRYDPKLKINPHVLDRAIKRYAAQIALAFSNNDAQLAFEIYDETASLPQTQTELALKVQGYEINGSLFTGNDNLVICFKDTVPCILKVLKNEEMERLTDLKKNCDLTCKHIIRFELVSSARFSYAIMPLLSTTLEHLKNLSKSGAQLLWEQIGEALTCLHKQGYAHMDVKPSNICIDSNGNFCSY